MASKKTPSKAKYRNLVQYRDLDDEEFEAVWENILESNSSGGIDDFEDRIKLKLEEFENDYDLTDMKVNDMTSLRALVQLYISLEDYEQEFFALRSEGSTDINYAKKLSEMMSDIRSDISRIQNDLKITRKIRSSDKDTTVVAYLDSLKDKARRFYRSKMNYILCPKCNMLLGTIWTLYPKDVELTFTCHRKLDTPASELECGNVFTVNIKDLIKNGGVNVKGVLPETLE